MLSGDLTRTVEEFRRKHPDTDERDVRQALTLVARVGARSPSAWSIAILIGLALLFGAGLLSLILGQTSVGSSEVLLVLGALAMIAMVSALIARVSRR